MSACLSVCLPVCLFVSLSLFLSLHFSFCASIIIYPSIDLSIFLCMYVSIYLRIYLSPCLSFALFLDLPAKMESWVQSWWLVPTRFAIFPSHLSKVLLATKKCGQVMRSAALSHKIILANLKIWYSKKQPHVWWIWLLYCACQPKCIFADPRTAIVFDTAAKPTRLAHFSERTKSIP